jgi:hypothetical protein
MKTIKLKQNLVNLIDDKAREDEGDACLSGVCFTIRKLNLYLSGDIDLTLDQRRGLLDLLVGNFSITLEMPLESIKVIRARKVDQPLLFHYYDNISELSYMAKPTSALPKLGRLNAEGTALFYASIDNTPCDKSLKVTLSEIEVNDGDKVNVLYSTVKPECELNVRYIGIWDYVVRNRKPYFLSQVVFDYYVAAHNLMKNKFSKAQLLAYQLCDAFFADVLSREGNDRLYKVTSILGEYFLEDSQVDGIIYTSVKVKGEPVIAINSSSVDLKVDYVKAEAITVNKSYGYNYYDYEVTHNTVISPSDVQLKMAKDP